jgi:hypothetical protein
LFAVQLGIFIHVIYWIPLTKNKSASSEFFTTIAKEPAKANIKKTLIFVISGCYKKVGFFILFSIIFIINAIIEMKAYQL